MRGFRYYSNRFDRETIVKDFGLKNALFEQNELWFDSNIPYWEKVLAAFKGKPVKYLEIGSYKGRSACWMLLNILTHAEARMTAIDPFSGSIEHRLQNDGKPLELLDIFKHNIKQTQQAKKVGILQKLSQEALIDLLAKKETESFDIIYVDGSHTAYDTLTDATLAWRLLKPQGVLIFDDYLWTFDGKPQNEPKVAVDAFLLAFKDYIDIISAGWQIMIRKKSATPV